MPPQRPIKKVPRSKPTTTTLPKTLILYGESGMGKSTLAGHFPNAGWIIGSQEQGVRYLAQQKLIPTPVWIDEFDTDSPFSFDKVVERISRASLDPKIDTLVCETITDFQQMAFTKNCKENFLGDMSAEGFFSFQRGPKNTAAFTWPELIAALNNAAGNGKNVILTAHCQTKEDQDPQGGKCLKYMPYAEKEIWQRAHKWASGVFLIAKRIQVDNDKTKKGLKQIAKEENQRLLFVDSTPYCVAKNWYGFDKTTIDLGDSGKEGYNNLIKEFARVSC